MVVEGQISIRCAGKPSKPIRSFLAYAYMLTWTNLRHRQNTKRSGSQTRLLEAQSHIPNPEREMYGNPCSFAALVYTSLAPNTTTERNKTQRYAKSSRNTRTSLLDFIPGLALVAMLLLYL